MILTACGKCGKIHQKGQCTVRTKTAYQSDTAANAFRNTARWQRLRARIRARDLSICRVCLDKGDWNGQQASLSVHHIVPIAEDAAQKASANNLITLCAKHHEDAEAGLLERAYLQKLAAQKPTLPPGE